MTIADHTNGRTYATVLRLSVSLSTSVTLCIGALYTASLHRGCI